MIRAMLCLAAIALLTGCGKQLSENTVSKTRGRTQLQDFFAGRSGGDLAAEALARHRKLADQSWAPPRMVVAPDAPSAPERLPAATLMQVEITIYPDITCAPGAARVLTPAYPERGAPMAPRELERLGTPISTARIWMLPSVLYSTTGPNTFGPEWLGNFLREAGAGGIVYFPAYQNCAMPGSATKEVLPREVFHYGEGLWIGPRQPFTARVVDACPADVVLREEVLRSHHVPFWRAGFGPTIGTTVERTRKWAAVSAHCPGGDARFELGPFVSGSPYDGHPDPAPTLVASEPPAKEPR